MAVSDIQLALGVIQTGVINQADIRKDLAVLIGRGLVFNIYKLHAFSIYLHKDYLEGMIAKSREHEERKGEVEESETEVITPRFSTQGRPLIKESLAIPLNVPFMTINQGVGWNRIIVLRRLRDRLMEEYHPVLNAVIADYERMLKPTEE